MLIGRAPPPHTNPVWSPDPVGQEPPLGFSIDEMQAVGEPHEIAASLDRLQAANPGSDPFSTQATGGAVDAPASGKAPLTDVVETAAPPSFSKKRK